MSCDDNCQVNWVVVLLIVYQEYTIPFLEHVQLYIEISSNGDGNGALAVAVNLSSFFPVLKSAVYDQFPSGSVSQGQILKTFHMPILWKLRGSFSIETYLRSVSDNEHEAKPQVF